MAFKCKKGADIGYTMLLYGYLDLLIITMAFEACKQNLIKAINIYYKYIININETINISTHLECKLTLQFKIQDKYRLVNC